MNFAYLGLLAGALGMLGAVDARLRLVLGRRPAASALVLGIGTALFLAWDVAAIHLGHYGRGPAPQSGVLLAPDLPLEELFFVVFLLYLALIVHALTRRVVRPRHDPRRVVRPRHDPRRVVRPGHGPDPGEARRSTAPAAKR